MVGTLAGFILVILFLLAFVSTLMMFMEHAMMNQVDTRDVKVMVLWITAMVFTIACIIIYNMNCQ